MFLDERGVPEVRLKLVDLFGDVVVLAHLCLDAFVGAAYFGAEVVVEGFDVLDVAVEGVDLVVEVGDLLGEVGKLLLGLVVLDVCVVAVVVDAVELVAERGDFVLAGDDVFLEQPVLVDDGVELAAQVLELHLSVAAFVVAQRDVFLELFDFFEHGLVDLVLFRDVFAQVVGFELALVEVGLVGLSVFVEAGDLDVVVVFELLELGDLLAQAADLALVVTADLPAAGLDLCALGAQVFDLAAEDFQIFECGVVVVLAGLELVDLVLELLDDHVFVVVVDAVIGVVLVTSAYLLVGHRCFLFTSS